MYTPLKLRALLPGILCSCAVALAAVLVDKLQFFLFGTRWAEALVFAIVIGILVVLVRPMPTASIPGLKFCCKTLLELAVVLLGASISAASVLAAGPTLIFGIVAVVLVSLVASIFIGKAFGLSYELSVLIACGNSICGNSAIAATAPVVNATSADVAAALTFTAFLGVIAVFLLPMIYFYGGASQTQYGVIAGLSVYAVPQVLAATAPVSTLSVQLGTAVKLIRVMMLGPILVGIGPFFRGQSAAATKVGALVPWFIIGFFTAMALRSFDLIPPEIVPLLRSTTTALTVISMAALGLSVDIRNLKRAGGRVILVATLSLLVLICISIGLVGLFPVG